MGLPIPHELDAFRDRARRRHRPACELTVDRWLIRELVRAVATGWRRIRRRV